MLVVTDSATPSPALLHAVAARVRDEDVQFRLVVLNPARAELLAMGSIGFLPPDPADDIGEAIRRARVYAGYAGWGPGQLEGELEEATA